MQALPRTEAVALYAQSRGGPRRANEPRRRSAGLGEPSGPLHAMPQQKNKARKLSVLEFLARPALADEEPVSRGWPRNEYLAEFLKSSEGRVYLEHSRAHAERQGWAANAAVYAAQLAG